MFPSVKRDVLMSLTPKVNELRVVAHDINADFTSITETWLQSHVHNDIIEIIGYNLERRDRQVSIHGESVFT